MHIAMTGEDFAAGARLPEVDLASSSGLDSNRKLPLFSID
jgi:hypothetical protein